MHTALFGVLHRIGQKIKCALLNSYLITHQQMRYTAVHAHIEPQTLFIRSGTHHIHKVVYSRTKLVLCRYQLHLALLDL